MVFWGTRIRAVDLPPPPPNRRGLWKVVAIIVGVVFAVSLLSYVLVVLPDPGSNPAQAEPSYTVTASPSPKPEDKPCLPNQRLRAYSKAFQKLNHSSLSQTWDGWQQLVFAESDEIARLADVMGPIDSVAADALERASDYAKQAAHAVDNPGHAGVDAWIHRVHEQLAIANPLLHHDTCRPWHST
jgi:hypothetical protein